MTLHPLHDFPDAVPDAALRRFEEEFRYPLGESDSFFISHGDDYTRFFRSIGDPFLCHVAAREGAIVGSLSAAHQPVLEPGGQPGHLDYLGDLKTLPGPLSGRVFQRLALSILPHYRPGITRAYGVVMDGTAALPDGYSGRCGIPGFRRVAGLHILRMNATPATEACEIRVQSPPAAAGMDRYRALARGCCASLGGRPELRSLFPPTWLLADDGSACGRLEDTLQAKRLFLNDGSELRNLHLACLAWNDVRSAVSLLGRALAIAHAGGYPALFLALPDSGYDALRPHLARWTVQVSSASIFGHGSLPDRPWILNSSEI